MTRFSVDSSVAYISTMRPAMTLLRCTKDEDHNDAKL